MTPSRLFILAAICAGTATAQDMEQHAAHVHGTAALDIAIDGNAILMELHAPGADIVGFEYVAHDEADKAAIAAALEILSRPEVLFLPDAEAGCAVTAAEARLLAGDEDHDAHGHDGDEKAEDHGHAEDDHDAQPEDGHAEDHDGEADGHEDAATHSEFQAEYAFICERPERLTHLALPYFTAFERSEQLEIRLITGKGAHGETVPRSAAGFALEGHF